MKHTGARTPRWLGLVVAVGIAQGLWAQATRDTQVPTVRELLARVRAREKACKSVEIEFSIQDRFPDNRRFESRGSLRVLHGTHFFTNVEVSFDDEVRSSLQTVVRPDGVWTRQQGPIEDVYLFTSPELRAEMEMKTRRLGEAAKLPGPISIPGEGVLGGAMLLALSRQFDLKVTGRKQVDNVSCLVLAGDRRKAQPPGRPPDKPGDKSGDKPRDRDKRRSPLEQPVPERVEVILREADAIPIRMTQFGSDNKPMVSFRIHKLAVDAKLDASAFNISKPETATFLDIEKHPPSWAQILRVREAFAELEEKEKADKDRPASQPEKKR